MKRQPSCTCILPTPTTRQDVAHPAPLRLRPSPAIPRLTLTNGSGDRSCLSSKEWK
ncbi:hypothetical protein BT69DRAFT_1291460 [Atractiella rhizophila]|nr:hypothetical protein BT69DRAFT_1291460 [Atractiella rhizophila]